MNGARAFFHPNVVQWLEPMRLNTSLQDTGQLTHRTSPQWNTKCMRFLKNFSNRQSATTKSELIKVAKEVWFEIKIRKIRRIIKTCLFVWI